MTGNGWVLVWAEDSTLQLAIVHADGSLSPAQTVVTGRAPWNPTLLPTPGGAWHLLWQDTDQLGEVRLYSALLQPDGTLSRGPLLVAPDPVSAYTAAVATNGTAAVVWADANPRPQLFGRPIDATGRPAAVPQPIAFNATLPALVAQDGGGWELAWLQRPTSPHAPDTLFDVMLLASSAALPWDTTSSPQTIGHVVLSGPTAYVARLSFGLDATAGYLLATLRDAASGQASTRLLAFDRASLAPLPGQAPLTLAPDVADGPLLDTGFRTTTLALDLSQTEASGTVVGWAVTADSQNALLPVALDDAGRLAFAYYQRGDPVGLERTDLEAEQMGWPVLVADRAGDLSLVWVAPPEAPSDPGQIWMITTRPLDPPG